ncbi:hypothetical protein M885DRAFT_543175 [Pelagophyceae sp. CCMP2097]|nr:hypothetical protein M885DRAFT_543175 [Pelagophyceae sp. CCMP2097]
MNPKDRLDFDRRADVGVCYFIIAGSESVPGGVRAVRRRRPISAAQAASLRRHCDISPWVLVEMSIGDVVKDGRRASRVIKLLPHLFFPRACYSVFVDWKLALRQDAASLVRRTLGAHDGAGFAVFRHPCTTAYTRNPICRVGDRAEAWWRYEARVVVVKKQTRDVSGLEAQVARYTRLGTHLDDYAEGAVVVRDHRAAAGTEVSCAWWAEYDRVDSSDRDQFALAFVLAQRLPAANLSRALKRPAYGKTTLQNGVVLVAAGPGKVCGDLCHWWDKQTVAKGAAKIAGYVGQKGFRRAQREPPPLATSRCNDDAEADRRPHRRWGRKRR